MRRTPPQLTREPLLTISARTIVAAKHPLATHRGKIPLATLAEHVQITHIDLSAMSAGYELRLKIPRVWRLSLRQRNETEIADPSSSPQTIDLI
jgi:DNA-binding transcriptional LysR family regulator